MGVLFCDNMTDKNVLRGPPLVVPNCSMAEYVLPKLKSLPKNHVLLVFRTQTVTRLCRSGLIGFSLFLTVLGGRRDG